MHSPGIVCALPSVTLVGGAYSIATLRMRQRADATGQQRYAKILRECKVAQLQLCSYCCSLDVAASHHTAVCL